jgi:hypothetical protein
MRFGSLASALVLSLLLSGAARATDRDDDGIDDFSDNCSNLANPDQRDTDGDGFGNRCDADLNGDGIVDVLDVAQFAVRAASGNPDADFDGDGVVGLEDYRFLSRCWSLPPGPGPLPGQSPGPGVVCDAGASARCTVSVVPGIELEVAETQLTTLAGGGFRIEGPVGIPTPVGEIVLPWANLDVVPGASLDGTTEVPDFGVGFLLGGIGGDVLEGGTASVHVTIDRGDAIQADIPLNDDVTYLSFDLGGTHTAELGPLRVGGSGGSAQLLIDPVDPFIYLAGDVSLVSANGGSGSGATSAPGGLAGFFDVDGLSAALGVGLSLSGRAPFVPHTTTAIRDRLPEIEGHLVMYASGEIPRLPVSFEAVSVTDLDPHGDGLALFGDDAESGRDHAVGLHGDVAVGLGLPGVEFDILALGASGLYSVENDGSEDPRQRFALAGQIEPFSNWGPLAALLFQIPENLPPLGFGLLVSSDPSETFFAVAFEDLVGIDTQSVGHGLGLELEVLTTQRCELLFDEQGMQLSAEGFGESIHSDVRFTERHGLRVVAPWEGDLEIIMQGTTEIADVQLLSSTTHLTPTFLRHTGSVVTPRHRFELTGEISQDGPRLEGTYALPISYSYPAVDALLEVAGLVAEHEATVAALEAARSVEVSELAAAQAELARVRSGLTAASNAVASFTSQLAAARRALAAHDAIYCWNFQWWEFWRWAFEGPACEAWKAAFRPALQGAIWVAEQALQAARTFLLALSGPAQGAELAYAAAQHAVALLDASLDEARAVLLAARAQRAALPKQDGEIDATVSLRLTNEGLSGSVEGSFQGVPIGGGRIESGNAGIVACFLVPQIGEELCATL